MSLNKSQKDWGWIKAKDFMLFNPKELVKKGTIVKNIPMDKIEPKTKEIPSYELTEYKGGVKFRNGDTLMARITPCLENGKISQVSILDYNEIGAGSTEFIVLREKEGISDKDFIYYLSNSEYFKEPAIKSMVGSSGRQRVQRDVIENLDIYVPPLDTQKKIGILLSLFDKKISLNKKINKNLEQLCQIIFKYYFIDFVPFNDNEFIKSKLGKIPKGWSITSVGNILNCKLGGTPSRSNESYWGGDIPWINSGKVNEFRIIEPSEYITDEGLKKSATKFLPAKTTVIAITGATLGQISLLEIGSCANQSVIGIIPNNEYPHEFVYPLISSILIDLLKHQTGGAQQHINKNNLESFNIVCPPVEVILKYKNIVYPLYAQISSNCFEINKLTKLRDTLLPKLMSGEIDVSKINCDLKIIIRKIYIKSSKLFLWRYLSENQNHIKNTKSNETLLKSRAIHKINKFLAKFNARYRYYRQ